MTYEDQIDYPIYAEIMKACETYTGMAGASVPGYFEKPYPQRLFSLNHLLKWHLLRELGDMDAFLRLSAEMQALPLRQSSKDDRFVVNMARWLNDELACINPKPIVTQRPKIVISLMVWGEEFVQKMLDYLVASWLAEGNIGLLAAKMHTTISIHSTWEDHEIITASPQVKQLRELGVNFAYIFIPDDIINGCNKDTIYWLVGASASLGIEYARVNEAAFHHACPDAVYSAGYFAELLRLADKHHNILQMAIRTDESAMREALKPYEDGNVLSIPSPDLTSLSLNCIHSCELAGLMNNRPMLEAIPLGHKIYWESENEVRMQAPHLNAAWLSPESLKSLKPRFYHSIDSELDLIARGTDFYVPKAEDKFYIAELSNQSSFAGEDRFLHIGEYGKLFWSVISVRDLFKFFYPGMTVALNRSLRPDAAVMPERQIAQEIEQLRYLILSADPYKGKKTARERLHDVQAYG